MKKFFFYTVVFFHWPKFTHTHAHCFSVIYTLSVCVCMWMKKFFFFLVTAFQIQYLVTPSKIIIIIITMMMMMRNTSHSLTYSIFFFLWINEGINEWMDGKPVLETVFLCICRENFFFFEVEFEFEHIIWWPSSSSW